MNIFETQNKLISQLTNLIDEPLTDKTIKTEDQQIEIYEKNDIIYEIIKNDHNDETQYEIQLYENENDDKMKIEYLDLNDKITQEICDDDDDEEEETEDNIKTDIKLKEEDNLIREYFKMECQLCPTKFDKFRSVKQHYRTAHKMNGYLFCCRKKFFKRIRVLDHIERHSNPDAFK